MGLSSVAKTAQRSLHVRRGYNEQSISRSGAGVIMHLTGDDRVEAMSRDIARPRPLDLTT